MHTCKSTMCTYTCMHVLNSLITCTEKQSLLLRVKTVWLPQQKLKAKDDKIGFKNIHDALHSNHNFL